MVEKLVPDPDAGFPPVAVHANVYAVVPPVAEAVHETAVPTVPDAGQLMVAASVSGLIVTDADFDEVAELASVTVTAIVSVPLTAKVVENEDAVAVALVTPFTLHAKWYGVVPPVVVVVQVTD